VGQKKALPPPPANPEPKPGPPYRYIVTMDPIEYVTEGSRGRALIVGRRGGREVCVDLPRDKALELSGWLREVVASGGKKV
jgi:hypothetical protein